tara:strand:+ start:93 stop:461 length:369 start_codon:yes stop_codon:yes gene_type:complete
MNTKKWKPFFIENSKIPVWLSKIAPIEIRAISFGLWVWNRGEFDERLKQHETIHFQQQLELLFVMQWILYGLYYLKGLIVYKDGETAYRQSPFEREAYLNEREEGYLENRPRYNWLKYRDID